MTFTVWIFTVIIAGNWNIQALNSQHIIYCKMMCNINILYIKTDFIEIIIYPCKQCKYILRSYCTIYIKQRYRCVYSCISCQWLVSEKNNVIQGISRFLWMFICNKDVNHTFNYPANHAFPTFYNMSQSQIFAQWSTLKPAEHFFVTSI